MAELPETVVQTLIAVVGYFRDNRNTIAIRTLQDKDGISSKRLELALPHIRLRSKIDNSGRVQCVEHGRGTIGPVALYSYRCNGCPLLDINECRADHTVSSEKQVDLRKDGAPRFSRTEKPSRRAPRS